MQAGEYLSHPVRCLLSNGAGLGIGLFVLISNSEETSVSECIFCKIVNKETPSGIVYENDKIVAFEDIYPLAPVHLLIVPKKHVPSVDHLAVQDKDLMGELILAAQKIAREEGISKTGYKLVFNVGRGGGQIIDHLHLHLLGGWKTKKEKDIPGLP